MSAVTFFKPKAGQRLAEYNNKFQRTYTVIYTARTGKPDVGAYAILAACPVKIGNTYDSGSVAEGTKEKDLGSWAQAIRVQQLSEDAKDWTVTVEYGPYEPREENPLDQKPEVSWDTIVVEEVMDRDRDGNAVLNTAYDYFDPPVTRDRRLVVLGVTRNEAQYDYDLAAYLEDGVNDADFLYQGDAGRWKISKIPGKSAVAKLLDGTEVDYWVLAYELIHNGDGWLHSVLNQGMRQLNSTFNGWEPILVKGQPISAPALLASNGRVLAAGGTPIYRTFKKYKPVDFSLLNFSGIDFGKGPI